MLRELIIFSPVIVVLIISLVCFILGFVKILNLQRHGINRKNNNIEILMIIGCLGLVGTCTVFAVASIYQVAFLYIMITLGCIGLFTGECSLHKNLVLARKNFFVPWVIVLGNLLIVIPLPILLNLHEPFTFIYVCIVSIIPPFLQILLVKIWMNKRNKS